MVHVVFILYFCSLSFLIFALRLCRPCHGSGDPRCATSRALTAYLMEHTRVATIE